MKTKSLIAACFAGTGIYLIITGSMTVIFSVSMLFSAYDPDNARIVLLECLALCVPFFGGVIFLIFASKLAYVVCRFAKTEEDFTAIISPEVAIVVACVVTGLTLAIGQLPEFVRLAAQQVLVAADSEYARNHPYEDYRVAIIRPGLYLLVAVVVVWKAKLLAGWLVSRYERS